MVIDRINELRVHLLELEQAAVAKMIKLQDNTHDNTNLTRTFATESAHIHRTLRDHANATDALAHLVSTLDQPADAAAAQPHVDAHRAENRALLRAVHNLSLQVYAAKPRQAEADRAALLQPPEGGAASAANASADRLAIQSARDATAALRRTQKLMAAELERSDATLRSLDAQGKALKDTLREQKSAGHAAHASKRALNRLKRRERTDKVLVAFGFTFFVLVVLHIMKKRLGSRLAWLGSSLLSWGQADVEDAARGLTGSTVPGLCAPGELASECLSR